jgi:hypothetical protein
MDNNVVYVLAPVNVEPSLLVFDWYSCLREAEEQLQKKRAQGDYDSDIHRVISPF